MAVSVLGLLTDGLVAQNTGVTFHVEDLEPIERTFHYSSSYYIANTVVKYNATDYRNGVIKSSILIVRLFITKTFILFATKVY